MGKKVSVYTSVHRTVSYQLLDHHPLEGDTETPTDGRHGTSVSLSRRVVTHHLSERTDRFFVGCVFVFTSTARRADARRRPSISPIEACAPTLASSRTATVEGPTATATTLDDARERERTRGDEGTRGPSRSNPRERARGGARVAKNAKHPSNEYKAKVGF